jgi:type I restriction enzyme S subunit
MVHRSSNIQNNRLSYDDNVYVDKTINEKLILKDKDILICVRNGSRDLIGKSALIRGKSVGETFGAFMSVFRTDKCQLFIYYLILSNLIQRQISQSLGATINQITNKTLNNFKIPYPPKSEEQNTIATVLADTDALIERLEKLIAKKKAIKQGAMQQLLIGKKRLPGFSGKWVVSPLGKLCNCQNGTALEKYFNNRNGLLVISIGNYSEVGKFVETSSYIDRKYFKKLKKFVLNKNDLTMILNDKTAVGTIIGRVLYIDENEKYIFNQRTMRLTAKDEIEPLFLYFQINSSKTHKYIVNLSKPGTQIYVNTNDITELPIAFPKSKSEQTAIATILSDMDAEIESLEQKRDKYIILKEGMMQQLLTGRIRIYANN